MEMWDLNLEDNEAVFTVDVPASAVTCQLNPSNIRLGGQIPISGTVIPRHPSVPVSIEFRVRGESNWTRLATVLTDTDSKYSYKWTPGSAGAYDIRSLWTGDVDHPGEARSPTQLAYVRIATLISLSVEPRFVNLGNPIVINGELSAPMNQVLVLVTYIMPDGYAFVRAATTASGRFQDVYVPESAGNWSVQARWEGDTSHDATASQTLSFTVEGVTTTTPPSGRQETPIILAFIVLVALVGTTLLAFRRRAWFRVTNRNPRWPTRSKPAQIGRSDVAAISPASLVSLVSRSSWG